MKIKSDVFLYQRYTEPTVLVLKNCDTVTVGDLTLFCVKGGAQAVKEALIKAMPPRVYLQDADIDEDCR